MFFRTKKTFLIFGIILIIFITFQAGIEIGKNLVICKICPPEEVDFSLFWQAYHILQKKFVNPEKLDIQQIIYGSISGMTKTLNDPYTIFLNPEETKKFEKELAGIFEGIGAEIGIKNKELIIISPLEGTPAQKAGLRAGDKILKINDIETFDISIEKAVSLIRGAKGTEVVLEISREGWEKSKKIKIIRDVIKIPSLKWKLINEKIAYLRIYQFYQPLIYDFRKTALEILNSPAKKIILDLRNNPGGYLDVVIKIGEWFLNKGDIIVVEDFGQNKERKEYKAEKDGEFLQYPIVVLINQGSASGSEIIAGALRDNRKIKIIGTRSFGKGSIQEAVRLKDQSLLKITVAKWLTPKGISISEEGIAPDIEVKITEDDYQQDRDPQLDKAIEVIKNL